MLLFSSLIEKRRKKVPKKRRKPDVHTYGPLVDDVPKDMVPE
jgi:hypothetical protein